MHKSRRVLEPGQPYPLGATWDGSGVNFALFSAHAEAVELCLFDVSGQHELARIALREHTDQVWHGYLPEGRPGLLYGYRVYGPYNPGAGHRFNPHKLLLDPYTRAIAGELNWSDANFGYRSGHSREDLSFDRRDNARFMPKCRVVDSSFHWGGDRRPQTPWSDTVILETHVKGFTQLHPQVAEAARGRFSGLASPAALDHLKRLGITAVELLPIHYFVNDRYLIDRQLTNYWGYNTLGFFAPDPRFLGADGRIDEFKTTIKRLHAAGIEVILDVVYNHTGEGNQFGPTLSWRGIDNATYYRLAEDRRFCVDYTGTGNTLNIEHPRVLQMVMDSLRYWVSEMHVDGFRFDLAPVLARENERVDMGAAFLDAVRQDPLLNTVKLIAEPWDLGPYGYQLGGFPPGWAEWNGAYRDTVRRFWKGDAGVLPEMGNRLTASADLFQRQGRRPWASVNFVTVHDGFTLLDLVSYNHKHNLANGELNRDGHNDNHSWNCGVEGPSNDPEIVATRHRLRRNHIATLMLSAGVPLLLQGDEMGRSQSGNNNAYCQDNEISWTHWAGLQPGDEALIAFTARMIELRRRHRLLSRQKFFRGMGEDGALKDISWLSTNGQELAPGDWHNGSRLGWMLGADPKAEAGEAEFLVFMNPAPQPAVFTVPAWAGSRRWELVVDTALETGFADRGQFHGGGDTIPVESRSMMVLIHDPAGR
jgi:glycogen operon protein